MKGGDGGATVVAGKASESLLYRVLTGAHEEISMPPEGEKLSAEELGKIEGWIAAGAEIPAEEAPATVQSSHWAFQPVTRPAVAWQRRVEALCCT